ncbi:MAG: CocE/NonD family hydrolase [Pseudomonadota bacterium]
MVNLVAADGDLNIVDTFPCAIREIAHDWIPMSDGVRLAARIWLPDDAETNPVPAVVEYIPYRKRDFTLPRDELIHPWYAGHGYAAIRLDIRGSGDSEGLPMDEYVAREQDDMLEALAWIAAQPWCTGSIGMIGISWGGFSGLQVAMRRPPELKAVVTLCSTDDRYADDVHYMGGCLLRNNLAWGGQSLAYSARPPDPEVVGERWRDMWRDRLDNLPFTTAEWMSHPTRDAYWRHGSVNEDWDAIRCPVYAVTGWADGYTNTALRLMAGLKVPRRCLIGPWAHGYPHIAAPGPAIGFLQETLRWWDRWLKGDDNGIDNEAMVRLWLQEPAAPAASYSERPGRWITQTAWPAPDVVWHDLPLGNGTLGEAAEGRVDVKTPLSLGTLTGEWNPHGIGPELPLDQRPDDALAVCFDGPPLGSELSIVGTPQLRLRVASDQPVATLVARLCAVAPDGTSTLVSWGALNLTHQGGHASPEALRPGEDYDVTITLNAIAQSFAQGSRLRIALSTGSWPLLWPAPAEATVCVDLSGSQLDLPVWPEGAGATPAPFPAAEVPPPPALTWLRAFGRVRRFERDLASGRVELILEKDDGAYRIDDHAMEVDAQGSERQWITDGEPLSGGGEVSWRIAQRRGDWDIAIEAATTVTADADGFLVEADIVAEEAGERVYDRHLSRRIPRQLA